MSDLFGYCINTLHHFEDKLAFMREARRVLRDDGRLMTIGLDPHSGVDRWFIYDCFEPVRDLDRQRYTPTGQIAELMRTYLDVNLRLHGTIGRR
jgi:ubiquinone/menaquinone biosynthesis C-methylase UbiE